MNNISQNPDALNILKNRRENLISDFINGVRPDFLKQYTRILDAYFHESYENSAVGPKININKNPYAIIALGGYGRQEQCIYSDIDLLFLFEKQVPLWADELVRELLYPLWNIGLDVGHATRSLKECISFAKDDIEILTSLLDARFVCGMSFLYTRLMEMLRKKIILDSSAIVIKNLIDRNHERHEYFGDCTYLLEPNLKDGTGGLRDYHTILWIARIKTNLRQPRDLEYDGLLSHGEFKSLTEALSFIWYVRNHLHYIAQKKSDQLYFRHQEKLAEIMNFRKQGGQQPVERFLGELHRHMNFLKEQQQMRVYEIEIEKIKKRKRKNEIIPKIDAIEIQNGALNFIYSKIIKESPELMMHIFEESARLKLPLSAESKRLIKEFLYLIDKKFRKSHRVLKSFEYILITRVARFNVLEAMLNTGILVKYIPQFNEIVNRIQYDEYHLYPVDRHLLRTVQTIKKFGTNEDPTQKKLCEKIYQELDDPKPLLWAALFHDIGKGIPGGNHSEKGAVIARDILVEKGYDKNEINKVCFLVLEHLFLVKIATRRDLQDEETAIFCARKIQTPKQLKMLYLLTVADSVATGPKAWNDWVEALLEELFLNVLKIMEKGELASMEAVKLIEEKKEVIKVKSSYQETEYLFNIMSPRYLLYMPALDMLEHINLYKKLGNANFVWSISKSKNLNTRIVTICAKDFPGIFSKISGVFTLNNINILDVQVYTWRNNIALDVFEVMPPLDEIFEKEKWENAEKDLESALNGQLDIGKALTEKIAAYGYSKPKTWEQPNKIVVDNGSSSFFTIIEVFTYDYPGLLFRITDALFKCRLDIWVAKIATKIDQVVDVFYVRDFDGQKVDSPEQVKSIKEAVDKVLLNVNPDHT